MELGSSHYQSLSHVLMLEIIVRASFWSLTQLPVLSNFQTNLIKKNCKRVKNFHMILA